MRALVMLWALAHLPSVSSRPLLVRDDSPSPTSTLTSPPTTTSSAIFLSDDILGQVPTCAQACYINAITNKFNTAQECSNSPSMRCLCGLTSTDGFTLDELTVKCITNSCTASQASESDKTAARKMCDNYDDDDNSSSSTVTVTTVIPTTHVTTVFPSETISTSSSSSSFSSSSSTTSQISPTALLVTTTTPSPSSTPSKKQTPTAGQGIGLAIGLSSAIMLGIIAIIYGRRRRNHCYDSDYFKNTDASGGHGTPSGSDMIQISAPIHDDPPPGVPPTRTFDHFGSTEEGLAQELFAMENAPSKAFVRGSPAAKEASDFVAAKRKNVNIFNTLGPIKPMAAFKGNGHQRLPSEDIPGSMFNERKKPPKLPLPVNVSADQQIVIPEQTFNTTFSPRRGTPEHLAVTQPNLSLQQQQQQIQPKVITPFAIPFNILSNCSPAASIRAQTTEGYVRSHTRNASQTTTTTTTTTSSLSSTGRPRKNPGLSVVVPPAKPSRHERIVKVEQAAPRVVPQSGNIVGTGAMGDSQATLVSTGAVEALANSMPLAGSQGPRGYPAISMERKKYADRESMMTEFEEDSLVSERERRMMASGDSFSTVDRTSAKTFPSIGSSNGPMLAGYPIPRATNISPPSIGLQLQQSLPHTETSYVISSEIHAYNPGGRPPRNTSPQAFKPYSSSDDGRGLNIRSLATIPQVDPADEYRESPFWAITDSDLVNTMYSPPEFPFQGSSSINRGQSLQGGGIPRQETPFRAEEGVKRSDSRAVPALLALEREEKEEGREMKMTPQKIGDDMFLDLW